MESRHGTLVANVVTTVTLTATATSVEVVNVDGDEAIYYTISVRGVAPTAPTVEGNNTEMLPAAVSNQEHDSIGSQIPIVKLISSGTPRYSVIARN